MDKTKFKKIGNIVLNVLMYIFLAFCIFTVIVTLLSKRDSDGAAEIFGYQMRIVTSDSMAKSEYTDVSDYKIKDIPVRSMVFVKVMPSDPEKADEWYRSLKVGDVLTFRYVYATQVTITHRITSIVEKETGGFIIELAGDNKDSDDGQLHQVIDTSVPNNTNYVIGKVTAKAYLLGAIMSFLMTPLGIVLAIIVPCLAIILLEILNIAKAVTEDRRKKDREEDEKKDEELKELRRRIAELEKEKSEQDTANEPSDAENADESSEGEETAEPEADEHEETTEAKDTAEEAADNNETGEKGIE
jgi:signal peptidase I